MAKQPQHYGVFSRDLGDGNRVRLVAATPADAVKFTYDGWTQDELSSEDAAKAAKEAAKADAPTGEGAAGDVAGDSTSTKSKTASK